MTLSGDLSQKTISHQIRVQVEKATAPFQYALSARAGCVCIAHALQAMTDADPEATILSVDGISATCGDDPGSQTDGRGRRSLAVRESVLWFPSTYLWEDDEGVVHEVVQGEGGEQGDALMPALFSLGQHRSLEAIQARLRPSERLFAFLDDVYAVCSPGRAADVFTTIQEQLATVGIRVHDGKTQLWNRPGRVPTGAQALTAAARRSDPDAIVWRGDTTLPPEDQGMTILGTPLGHEQFVRARLVTVSAKHDRLMSQIVGIPYLQCAWILLLYCAAA